MLVPAIPFDIYVDAFHGFSQLLKAICWNCCS